MEFKVGDRVRQQGVGVGNILGTIVEYPMKLQRNDVMDSYVMVLWDDNKLVLDKRENRSMKLNKLLDGI